MSIQDLIDAAPPGGAVVVSAGVYNEQLIINKSLTLQGPTAGEAIIDASGLLDIPTIQILSDNVTIKDLIIQNGPLHGIQAGDVSYPDLTKITIANNSILGHGNAGILTNHGASMTIKNNNVRNNGIGSGFNRGGIILYPHGATDIIDNLIINNNIDGIFARASDTGLVITNNVIEDHLEAGILLTWDERNVSISNNTIKNCGDGNFDEQGGIVIVQSMAEIIQDNTIEACAPSAIFWGWVPTTGSPPSEILISGNEIKNNARDGIYLFSQGSGGWIPPDIFPLEPLITGNIIENNIRAGIYVSNLYYYSPGSANPTIHDNNITGNDWGVLNATAQIVNATENWWGNNSGPYQPDLNPDGAGDPVSDRVDFIPWQTRQPIIKISGCTVQDVSLEGYDISPLGDGTAKVKLIIKVKGRVFATSDGVGTMFDFEKWFVKRLIMKVPELKKISPVITPTSTCWAFALGNMIQISIELCIAVDMQGRYNVLIPVRRFCLPRTHLIECNATNDSSLSEDIQDKGGSQSQECINAEVIFSSCSFREDLNCTILINN